MNTLPINTALLVLIDQSADIERFRLENFNHEDAAAESQTYHLCMSKMECLASFLRPVIVGTNSVPTVLSRPMQRKLVSLINCQLMEEEGRSRAIKAARSLGERSVTELILQHQNPQQLSALLWAAVRARGCQFLGPAMQEEVLKLVLLALEDGSALSRKILVMFVVQKWVNFILFCFYFWQVVLSFFSEQVRTTVSSGIQNINRSCGSTAISRIMF